LTQVIILGIVMFCTVGMFGAMAGSGGGGQVNTDASNKASIALYATFSIVAFFGGTIVNALGVRISLTIGTFGYALYVASFLGYNHLGPGSGDTFVIVAGCVLGFTAGLIWTAQGSIILSYPGENEKAKYWAVFYVILNLGSVIGGVIPVVENWNNTAGTVTDGTYITFLVIVSVGMCLPIFLVPTSQVVRNDGTKVIIPVLPTWKKEFMGLWITLRDEPWIVLLFPMFFASTWFAPYQGNDFIASSFTLRTRALSGLLVNLGSIVGVSMIGPLLDCSYLTRVKRARIGAVVLFVLIFAVWGGGWVYAKDRYRGEVVVLIDVEDSSLYGPLGFLSFMYGFFDSWWQTYMYWMMGTLSNDQEKLAYYVGFYKGLQSAGDAISFQLDLSAISYQAMFLSTWVMLPSSLLMGLWVIFNKVVEHNPQLMVTGEKAIGDEIPGVILGEDDDEPKPVMVIVDDGVKN
jgi:hypothetical protein